jgi:Cu/Ag efflux pump CusA
VYGGQFESAEQTTRILMLLGMAVVLGIGLLLQVAFGSVRDALLVMVNLPLALVGGVLGVHVTGGIVTVGSLIGFITVLGIATRNGIMLVSHIRHLRDHEGISDLRESVERGAMERLAPILMTALATGLALVPLALGGDQPGNEIQTPMAVVILCGLLSSTALNMLVLPTLYLRFRRDESGVASDRSGQGAGRLQTVLAVDTTTTNEWDVISGLVKTKRLSH